MSPSLDATFEPAPINPDRLRWIRAIWAALIGVCLVTLTLAVPARYTQLTSLAFDADRAVQQLTIGEHALLYEIGIPKTVLAIHTYAVAIVVIELLVQFTFIALGMALFLRESRNWVAIYIALGLITYSMYAVPTLDALLDGPRDVAVLSRFVQSLGLFCALTFFFVFPDGRFVPRWTIWVSVLWGVMVGSAFLVPEVPWNFLEPWNIPPPTFLFLMAWWSFGLIAQVIRFQRTQNPIRRQQTKWVVYSVVLAVIGYAVTYLPRLLVPNLRLLPAISLTYSTVSLLFFYFAIMSIPVAMTFSIRRYRLWDIDRLIGQTLLYGVTSAALVAIYVGVVLITRQVIREVTGQSGSAAAIVVTTIVVALIAQRVKDRFQATIDRRFFRARYDAARTIETFSATARKTVDLNELTTNLTDVVTTTLHPEHISLWLRTREGDAGSRAGRPLEAAER